MALTACPDCGNTTFTGSVVVNFFDVRIEVDADGSRSADWADAPAEGDQVVAATCTGCGHEQRPNEA